MILVAGGSGRLGTRVVNRLVDRGLDVRVLTRDPRRARHLGASAIDIVEGSKLDEPAFKGLIRAAVDLNVGRAATTRRK